MVLITGVWKWAEVKKRGAEGDKTTETLLWSWDEGTVIKSCLSVLDNPTETALLAKIISESPT